MQKRKGHFDSVGRALTVFLICLALAAGPAPADSWERGMGGVHFPRRAHPAAGERETHLIIFAGGANPFSIAGLYESDLFLRAVRRKWAAGSEWRRTGFGGFSDDRLEAFAGFSIPRISVSLDAVGRLETVSVNGLGRETYFDAAFALTVSPVPWLSLEAETRVSGPEDRFRLSMTARGPEGGMVVTAGSDSSGRAFRMAGASLKLNGDLSVGGGYDLDSGEVSGGIFLSAPVTAAFSCGIHPVLGMTFSASAGVAR